MSRPDIPSMDESLARIRALKGSKIPTQAAQATLLMAVESALQEDSPELVPAAYFAAFLALLDQEGVAANAAYLLALIVPHISEALLTSKLDVLVPKLAPILTDPESDASGVRSCISALEVALAAQPLSAWQIPFSELGALRTLSGILALAQDNRPKVRRRAVEAISYILAHAPPGPKIEHPGSLLCADTALEAARDNVKDQQKCIHALQLAKAVAPYWPKQRSEELCDTLLQIAKTSEQFVVMAVFDVFDALFSGLDTDSDFDATKLAAIRSALLDLAPAKTDKQLAPAWLAAVAQAYGAYVRFDAISAFTSLLPTFELVVTYLTSTASDVVESSGQCIVALFSEVLTAENVLSKKSDAILQALGAQLFKLLHVEYQAAWTQVCQVFVAFLDQTRWKSPVDDSIKVIGVLRSDERLSRSRGAADEVIAAAIRALGPEKVIDLIPLQLNLSGGAATGRAWMLPLLRENIQNAKLQHFIDYFVPLAEQFDKVSKSMQNDRNAKIISTLRDQVWNLLPHYCDLPIDAVKSFMRPFVQRLLSMLYDDLEYRILVSNSLKVLVQSNAVYSAGVVDEPMLLARFPVKQSRETLEYISTNFGADILKALLNVLSATSAESKGVILDTINVYLSVLKPDALKELFNQVSSVLGQALSADKTELVLTMLDVITNIAPYLGKESEQEFHNIFKILSARSDNAAIQKKAYLAFCRFCESDDGEKSLRDHVASIEQLMIELGPSVLPAARKTRIQALARVVSAIPSSDLYFIPSILSEVILATKDMNEKTREASFQLLVAMGRRMEEGGTVDHAKMPELDDDAEVPATLAEYFTMVLAGLLGSTPHMISATVTAITYIFYEFKDELPLEQVKEIVETVWVFLTSPNREIVNSVLGFVKVTILVLPKEDLEPHLRELLGNLLSWGHEHKQHFRVKVRHIIERLIRRFGYDTMATVFPQDDIKLLQNIHKSKERARRKKTDGDQGSKERKFDNEFDEAVYGSSDDSEARDDGPDEPRKSSNNSQKPAGRATAKPRASQYIVGGDEPLDLLDQSALSRISSSKPQTANAKRSLKHRMTERDGKLVIRDESDNDDLDGKSALKAYSDALKSGPVRTQSGKLKYKRGKRPQEDSDDDEPVGAPSKKQARKTKLPKRRRFER